MRKEKPYGGLDYFKMAAAFLVVAIHTSPLASLNEGADFIFTRVIARTAVPFFFMVTGFFLLPRYLFFHSMDSRPVFKLLKKDLILYIIAVMLYLPVNLYAGQLKNVTVGGFFRMFFVDGTFYHLWYLPAAIFGILFVWFLGCRLPFQVLAGISLILYGVGLFGDSYYGLVEQLPLGKRVYDMLFSVSSYTRNGLFFAPVFLLMGAAASRKVPASSKGESRFLVDLAGTVASLALMAGEALTLRKWNLQRHDSMYVMLIPTMFFLFCLLRSLESLPAKKWRRISTGIYLLHPLCIILVRGGAKALHLESLFLENSLVHYLTVCVCSWAASAAVWKMQKEGFWAAGKKTKPMGREGSYEKGRAWIELSRENLGQNVETLRRLAGGRKLMPVLKADAYGHGAVLIAEQLQDMGIDAFCVASVAEGVALRKNGITGDILILGYTHPKDFFLLRRYRLIQTAVDCDYAERLNRYGKKIKVHIKIDTGMHRLGERAENDEKIVRLFGLKNLQIDGVYTHLCADETREPADFSFTEKQKEEFDRVVTMLRREGYSGFKTHLSASYGLFNYPQLGGDYVRVGIALYGVLSERPGEEFESASLCPVLSCLARIVSVKDVYRGESVGYGLAYQAQRPMRVAVLAIGYADGLPRELSCGVGSVLIHGRRAPVVGRICMDQTIVDVSGIPDVKAGETGTVIGKSRREEITAYELAEKAETITNEILSRLGKRLERMLC